MLSSEEYNVLQPYHESIKRFAKKESVVFEAHGSAWPYIEAILKNHGGRPIDYSCEGCKIGAINDIYNLIVEYENSQPTANA